MRIFTYLEKPPILNREVWKFKILINFTEISILRNVGIGYCSAVARIGGIMAPVIFMLAVISPVLPYIIFGFFGIFGAFCAFFLPEVLDRTLPDSVEEVIIGFLIISLIVLSLGRRVR